MSPLNRQWMRSAACNGRIALFTSGSEVERDRALSICAGCPVRQECADYALSTEMVGVVVGGVDLAKSLHPRYAGLKLRRAGAQIWRACIECDAHYTPKDRRFRYCSEECSTVAHARQQLEYDTRYRERVSS